MTRRAFGVLSVFGEMFSLMARHSGGLMQRAWPLAACGCAFLAAASFGLLPDAALPAAFFATITGTLLLAAAFSVQAHRLLLSPGGPRAGLTAQMTLPVTWRYMAALLLIGLAGTPPAAAGLYAAGAADALEGFEGAALLSLTLHMALPVLAAQACTARLQLLFLPGLSLERGGAWRVSRQMARGNGWRLAALNMLVGAFWLGVNFFTGWIIGNLGLDGSQAQLEMLSEACSLPVQLTSMACLQAACFARLDVAPEA